VTADALALIDHEGIFHGMIPLSFACKSYAGGLVVRFGSGCLTNKCREERPFCLLYFSSFFMSTSLKSSLQIPGLSPGILNHIIIALAGLRAVVC